MAGLEHLFLHGICHRDVKPENLLWDAKAKCAKLPRDQPLHTQHAHASMRHDDVTIM